MRVFHSTLKVLIAQFTVRTSARLTSVETGTDVTLSNARLSLTILKSTGAIHNLTLDGQDLLGTYKKGSKGKSGIGPYLDCYCIKKGSGSYTPGSIAPKYKTFEGSDASGTPFAGVVMSETLPESGQTLSMFWTVSGEETGIHTFARVQYPDNPAGPTRQTLQEFRTLFRPNSDLWTHLSVNDELAVPRPRQSTLDKAKVVQDATWDLSAVKNDPFVTEFSDYFTKYSFADALDKHTVHGMFGRSEATRQTRVDDLNEKRQTKSTEGTWGAWLVLNSKDTFYGGPRHTDLTVDGIVYNYIVSNHYGANVPNITAGFDRTFGPAYYYFNHGSSNTTLAELRHDAAQYASPIWNLPFYEAISGFVPGYVSPSKRTTFNAQISLPHGADKATVILSADGLDFQDNAATPNAYQYWSPVSSTGQVRIPMVVPGKYRMTIQARGVFGDFVLDGVDVGGGVMVSWKEESSGQELWRLGIPDHSAGEFRHGFARDKQHSLAPQEYRIYWGAYNYEKDFPNGVRFRIGESDQAEDWNYVHWSEFKGSNTSDWAISWHQSTGMKASSKATLTVQLAGVKGISGNSHVPSGNGKPWPDLPFVVLVNNQQLETWNIPYHQSSSCAVRSGISCYSTRHKFVFNSSLFRSGENEIQLRLPYPSRANETAKLPGQVYVQYDALRLEVE